MQLRNQKGSLQEADSENRKISYLRDHGLPSGVRQQETSDARVSACGQVSEWEASEKTMMVALTKLTGLDSQKVRRTSESTGKSPLDMKSHG
jgi:hypothetical protein